MKKSPFAIFSLILLVAFSIFSIQYWTARMIKENYTLNEGAVPLVYTSAILLIVVFFIILTRFTQIRKNGIHLICILWILMMPFVIYLSHGYNSYYVLTILWPALFELGYILTRFEGFTISNIRKWFIVIFVVGLFYFIESRINVGTLVQTNTIYFPFLTFPFMLCVKNNKLQFIVLAMISALGLISYKRGILLIIAVIWFVYLGSLLFKKKNLLASITLVFAIIVGCFYSLNYIDDKSGGVIKERTQETEDDDGGGRLEIYAVTFLMIQSSSATDLLRGHGHYGVKANSPLDLSAHNDVLEVIYDYGLIIFFLYLCLWIYLIKRLVKLIRINAEYAFPYFVSVVIFVVMSMISHIILYTSYFNYLVVFWGCVEGIISQRQQIGLYEKII